LNFKKELDSAKGRVRRKKEDCQIKRGKGVKKIETGDESHPSALRNTHSCPSPSSLLAQTYGHPGSCFMKDKQNSNQVAWSSHLLLFGII
jgi:hypothetical protein